LPLKYGKQPSIHDQKQEQATMEVNGYRIEPRAQLMQANLKGADLKAWAEFSQQVWSIIS
jgi:hypothetical protein